MIRAKQLAPLVALFALLMGGCEWHPGGMSPGYPAADYDSRLTRVAESALPIIDALAAYQKKQGRFPAKAGEMTAYLPSGFPVSPEPADGAIGEWYYLATDAGNEYRLVRKLGWDPSLQYYFNGAKGEWSFEPGDGSPSKTILLTPEKPARGR